MQESQDLGAGLGWGGWRGTCSADSRPQISCPERNWSPILRWNNPHYNDVICSFIHPLIQFPDIEQGAWHARCCPGTVNTARIKLPSLLQDGKVVGFQRQAGRDHFVFSMEDPLAQRPRLGREGQGGPALRRHGMLRRLSPLPVLQPPEVHVKTTSAESVFRIGEVICTK